MAIISALLASYLPSTSTIFFSFSVAFLFRLFSSLSRVGFLLRPRQGRVTDLPRLGVYTCQGMGLGLWAHIVRLSGSKFLLIGFFFIKIFLR